MESSGSRLASPRKSNVNRQGKLQPFTKGTTGEVARRPSQTKGDLSRIQDIREFDRRGGRYDFCVRPGTLQNLDERFIHR